MEEKYTDLLRQLSGVQWSRMMYGEWVSEKGLEDVKSEDIYQVMKRTGMTYQEVQDMTYDDFMRMKEGH